jgi:hypothetical protein
MNLVKTLKLHGMWARGEPGGVRANLRDADLTTTCLAGANLRSADLAGANLAGANLTGAYLRGAYLRGADLAGADLRGADLAGADLRDADLAGAYLRDADLRDADLRDADLAGTCLDPKASIPPIPDAVLTAAGLEIVGDRVYGWRTATSQYVGSARYEPGTEHRPPWFSVAPTGCHPGIYLAGAAWFTTDYPDAPLVRCWTLRSDLHHAGDKFRTRCLHVVAA